MGKLFFLIGLLCPFELVFFMIIAFLLIYLKAITYFSLY